MLREQKNEVVAKMRADLDRSAGVLFLDFTGLTVEEADALRGKLRAEQIDYRVMKNTLMKRALVDTPFEEASTWLKGTPTGVVLGYDDPVAPAKITFDFLKECEHLKVKGGIADNRPLSAQEVEGLSKMPSKAEVQGMIVRLAMSPGASLAAQLKNPAGRVVGAIEALVTRLEGAQSN